MHDTQSQRKNNKLWCLPYGSVVQTDYRSKCSGCMELLLHQTLGVPIKHPEREAVPCPQDFLSHKLTERANEVTRRRWMSMISRRCALQVGACMDPGLVRGNVCVNLKSTILPPREFTFKYLVQKNAGLYGCPVEHCVKQENFRN